MHPFFNVVRNIDIISVSTYTVYMAIQIDQALQKLGLTESESRVYVATLELGKDSVQSIAKKAGVKRPTTYLILDDLVAKGLVSKLPRKHKTQFIAENPSRLHTLQKERERLIESALPVLQGLYSVKGKKPQVHFFEGKDGAARVYNEFREAVRYICFYGSIQSIMSTIPESMVTTEQVQSLDIPTKEIMLDTPYDRKYAQTINRYPNPKHRARIIPKQTDLGMDSAIFDNKVGFISLKKEIFGIIIESAEIAQSYRILFDLAWKSAVTP